MVRDQGRIAPGLVVLDGVVEEKIDQDGVDWDGGVLAVDFAAEELDAPDAAAFEGVEGLVGGDLGGRMGGEWERTRLVGGGGEIEMLRRRRGGGGGTM